MMRKTCHLILFFSCFSVYGQRYLAKINQWNIGAGISQFYYVFGAGKIDVNARICSQYKPFNFLSLNSSFIYNSLNNQMGKGYLNLNDYHCKGVCIKLGFDASLRLGRYNRNTRAFIGFQGMFTRYSESGRFEIENYWGTHVRTLETKPRMGLARELILGFQFSKKKWLIRPQVYFIYVGDDQRISENNLIADDYRSPFVPGFGLNRLGLNLILLYRLRKE